MLQLRSLDFILLLLVSFCVISFVYGKNPLIKNHGSVENNDSLFDKVEHIVEDTGSDLLDGVHNIVDDAVDTAKNVGSDLFDGVSNMVDDTVDAASNVGDTLLGYDQQTPDYSSVNCDNRLAKYEKLNEEQIQNSIKANDLKPSNDDNPWWDCPHDNNTNSVNGIKSGLYNYLTESTTVKNPSLDLRGDIHVEKQSVGPFLNSTYERNPYARPLC